MNVLKLMRWSAMAVLLAGCQSLPTAESITELLAQDPIDIERLGDELAIPPGALRILPPPLPPVSFQPTPGPWQIVNTGDRPVWLQKSAIRVETTFTPFVPDRGYRWGGGRLGGKLAPGERPPRPEFEPSEWVLLAPGGRFEIRANPKKAADDWHSRKLVKPKRPADWIPGLYRYRCIIPPSGKQLVWQARDFNAWKKLKRPRGTLVYVLRHSLDERVFPTLDSPGSPWHGSEPLSLTQAGSRRLEFTAEHPSWDGKPYGLELEAFILQEGKAVMNAGVLPVVALEGEVLKSARNGGSGRVRARMVYSLPETLAPGSYRLIARAPDAHGFFIEGKHMCDAPGGAASRWIRVTVPE